MTNHTLLTPGQPLSAYNNIAIGIICPGVMELPHVLSWVRARDMGADILIKSAGPYLDVERNNVIQLHLDREDKREWLVFIDADVEFNPDDIPKLCVDPDNHPLVTGVYHNHFVDKRMPVVYRYNPESQVFDNHSCVELGCCPEYPIPAEHADHTPLERDELGMIPVDGFGAGLLAIHRSVLDRFKTEFEYHIPGTDRTAVSQAWFVEQTLWNGVWYGEDFMFSLRAKNLDIPIHCLPTVKGTHHKKAGF